MFLTFNTIIDLITNTMKNCFLYDEITMKATRVNSTRIEIEYILDKDENKKYKVCIWTKPKNTNEREVISISLDVMMRCDDFPQIISSFTASGINHIEEMRNTLNGCWFYEEELENL